MLTASKVNSYRKVIYTNSLVQQTNTSLFIVLLIPEDKLSPLHMVLLLLHVTSRFISLFVRKHQISYHHLHSFLYTKLISRKCASALLKVTVSL